MNFKYQYKSTYKCEASTNVKRVQTSNEYKITIYIFRILGYLITQLDDQHKLKKLDIV